MKIFNSKCLAKHAYEYIFIFYSTRESVHFRFRLAKIGDEIVKTTCSVLEDVNRR